MVSDNLDLERRRSPATFATKTDHLLVSRGIWFADLASNFTLCSPNTVETVDAVAVHTRVVSSSSGIGSEAPLASSVSATRR